MATNNEMNKCVPDMDTIITEFPDEVLAIFARLIEIATTHNVLQTLKHEFLVMYHTSNLIWEKLYNDPSCTCGNNTEFEDAKAKKAFKASMSVVAHKMYANIYPKLETNTNRAGSLQRQF